VAVKIKLKRLGKMRNPQYRIVVADARTKRDGRAIEEIGKYHPKEHPSLIEVDSARAQYWLGVGAQPTEAVAAILKVTGDWQRSKGLPGAEGTLQVRAPRADKKAVFEAAAKESADEPRAQAVTPRVKRAPAKVAAPEVAAPEVAAPEVAAPEVAAPEAASEVGQEGSVAVQPAEQATAPNHADGAVPDLVADTSTTSTPGAKSEGEQS
jgi:small subunit ribosomal protein S16